VSSTPNDPNQPGGYGNDPNQPGGYGGAPSYGNSPAGGNRSNPMAVVALVLGILSILACLFWFISAPLAIAAIVLGVLGSRKAKAGAGQGGLAKAGLITGIIGLLLSIAVAVATIAGLNFLENSGCDAETMSQTELEQCLEDELTS